MCVCLWFGFIAFKKKTVKDFAKEIGEKKCLFALDRRKQRAIKYTKRTSNEKFHSNDENTKHVTKKGEISKKEEQKYET